MTTLLTILGTGDYKPVRYELDGRSSREVTFVQAALAELVSPARVVVLLTPQARDKHWAAFTAELADRGLCGSDAVCPLEIPIGSNEDELWLLFQRVGEAVRHGGPFVYDATHGFRSLQLVVLLALAYFRRPSDARVERILYGAFDARQGDPPVAPIFDLTPMLLLLDWVEAIAEWERTGSARRIVELADEPADARARRLRGADPLVELQRCLRELSDVLTAVHHDQFARSAAKVRQVAARLRPGAGGELGSDRKLAALGALAAMVERSVAPLDLPPGNSDEADVDYLRVQLAAARFYVQCGRLSEALAVMREMLISTSVRIARAAGIDPIGQDGPSSERFRGQVDFWVRVACGAAEARQDDDRAGAAIDQDRAAAIEAWVKERPVCADALCKAHNAIQAERNRLLHCWVGGSRGEKQMNRNTIRNLRKKLDEAIDAAAQALEALSAEPPPEAAPVSPEPASPAPGGLLVNLSNHPLATWSEEQLAAARRLASELVDIPFPEVPPHETTDDIAARAAELLQQVPAGCTHAMVMGEMTLTHALVRRLQERGIVCLAACGPRLVQEGPEGRISRFEFRGFREYPC